MVKKDISGCSDYCAQVECICNIQRPLLKLAKEQLATLCQEKRGPTYEPVSCETFCDKLKCYLPSIITTILGLILIVYMCLYFGDILCNKDIPVKKPPAF